MIRNSIKIELYVVLLIFLLLPINCAKPQISPKPPINPPIEGDVSVWLTTANEANLLKKQSPIKFTREIGDFTIVLDSTTTYQTIDGFGAALTGSSAHLISALSTQQRNDILEQLFDPEKGIGINYLRLTIGSSDFSIGTYSYCDTPNIEDFAIPKIDKAELIPVLKQILKIDPNIKIMASPWSAPAWMKKNNSMYGGSLKGESVYNDFALYFLKYIKAFENEGINIDAITLQNEPMYATNGYPTMKMLWNEQNTIIRDYLGPLFTKNNIKTKIIIWDHNFNEAYYPINILNDKKTREYVAGTGWHGYAGKAVDIEAVQLKHPDKDIYFTEQSGGGWNTDTRIGNMFWYMKEFLMATVNRGSKNFLMWNLALNEKNGPTTTTFGGCQNCRGVVTVKEDGTFIKNEEYFLIGHFSKFIRLNAFRIKNFSNNYPKDITVSSFLNRDGTKVAVVMNRSGKTQKYSIRCGKRKFTYNQPNESVVTFYF